MWRYTYSLSKVERSGQLSLEQATSRSRLDRASTGITSKLAVSNPQMTRTRKASVVIIAFLFFGLLFRELSHFYRYRHFVPLGLHADVDVTTSNDIIGVDGTAKIYQASLTNYGLLPATIVVCDYRVSGAPEIEVNYVVERWDRDVNKWKFVPEWDFYGYRLEVKNHRTPSPFSH